MALFVEKHSSEIMVLSLVAMVLVTLIIIVPQLLRNQQKIQDLRHAERIKGLEKGLPVPPTDDRARAAGRTSILVPTVAVIVAGTVTCFLEAFRSENVLAVSIAVWSVAGVVSLAAITGGVALMGRLAQIESGDVEEQEHIRL